MGIVKDFGRVSVVDNYGVLINSSFHCVQALLVGCGVIVPHRVVSIKISDKDFVFSNLDVKSTLLSAYPVYVWQSAWRDVAVCNKDR